VAHHFLPYHMFTRIFIAINNQLWVSVNRPVISPIPMLAKLVNIGHYISTKSHPAFLIYEPSLVSSGFFFFLFSSRCESFYKIQMHYPIPLKFGTLKGRIKAHPDTKFGCNTINGHKVINNYLQKITPIYCHVYRVNR